MFSNTRRDDIRNFDFIPHPNPGERVQSFRRWLDTQAGLLAVVQVDGPEPPFVEWVEAIIEYGNYMGQETAATVEHVQEFVARRRAIAESDRRLLNEFRPAPNFRVPEPAADNGNPLPFHQWVIREYQQPYMAWSRTAEEAVDEDMNLYESYLQRNGTQSQINDFRVLRTNVANNTFDFDPPANTHRPSFRMFVTLENERRLRVGQVEMTRREALREYPRQVLDDDPEEDPGRDFIYVRDHYFEENRRQMYGHARSTYSHTIERLRAARTTYRELVLDSLFHWSNSDQNPVHRTLSTALVNSRLRRFIALEENPSVEDWSEITAAFRSAQSLIDEAEQRVREQLVDEMAQTEIPRTPATVDDDASTVISSPPRRLVLRSTSHNDPNDGFPNATQSPSFR